MLNVRSVSRRFRAIAMTVAVILGFVSTQARGDVAVYTQPPNPAGGQYPSAWYAPDGLDSDTYVWDSFSLASSSAITQIQWRGAYTNYLSGAGRAPVYDFTISIYGSIAGNSQPNIGAGPLVSYDIGSNAGETQVGTFGGVIMYDYHFTLPSPFQATGGTVYWVQIEAWQGLTPLYYWPPDWSIASGTGGNGSHFRRITGGGYASLTGDCAFTMLASSLPNYTINATASPTNAGTITGAGAYPQGSTATLVATANTGYGFQRWTENGSQVSTNRTYQFTVNASRTLVANFVNAYTITTSSLPTYGGTTSGGGTFNAGTSVTVHAVANQGFVFSQWLNYGTPVSSNPDYTFSAAANMSLAAQFTHSPNSTTFTFDNASAGTPFPVTLNSDGLTATFSGTGYSYSIQQVGTVGIAPAGFSGNCVYPSSVFLADLLVDFSNPVSFFSIMYSTQELACDNSATMRVTGYLNGVQVGTATTTAPVPGTWPTGVLSINIPGGFDHAVVHYDARPPTCQDYGVIFMADNLTVTSTCVAASITQPPTSVTVCRSGPASFSVATGGSGQVNKRWQISDAAAPGGWVDMNDGDNTISGGRRFHAAGALTQFVTISPAAGSSIIQLGSSAQVRCVATNACGNAPSTPATLAICAADFNCDAAVNSADFFDFLTAFFAFDAAADFNQDATVNSQDFFDFIGAFFTPC